MTPETFRSSECLDKVASALTSAAAEIRPAGKSKKNAYDNYDYACEEDWYEAVRPAITKHGLAMIFSCPTVTPLEDRKTRNGVVEYAVRVSCALRILHSSGQWIELYGVGEGQDRGDKAAYKAITGAKKYLYAMAFAIPTTDDPEKDSHDSDQGQQAEPKSEIYTEARKALEDSQKSSELMAVVAKIESAKKITQSDKQELLAYAAERMRDFAAKAVKNVQTITECDKSADWFGSCRLFDAAEQQRNRQAFAATREVLASHQASGTAA